MPEPDIFEKFGKLRGLYPDDISRIEADEKRVKKLLEMQEYSQLGTTKQLLDMARRDVVLFRRYLATDRRLLKDLEAARELWASIDARVWFIEMVSKDFKSELAQIEADLERELQP